MSGIERDQLRVKTTGEVFTPTPLVNEILDHLPEELFADPSETFIDPCCGDGQFLSEVLIRKLKRLATDTITPAEFETALSTIYGVDLMIDNVDLCRDRLLCGQEHLRHIVEKNIQCRDALTFGFNFESMGPARRKTEQKLKVKQQKLLTIKELNRQKEAREKKLFGTTLA